MERVELHCHTMMSAMDGVITPTDLIKRAAELGHKAVAITDHGVVQAFPEAHKTAADMGMKDIYGAEIALANQIDPLGNDHHAILLVKNTIGLKNLYKLISISHTDYFSKIPLVPKSILSDHREGLLVGSACDIGELHEAIIYPVSEEHLVEIAEYYDYFEIQPHKSGRYDWMKKTPYNVEAANRKIVQLGQMLGKSVVATGDVHFLNLDDAIIRSVLENGKGYENTEKQPPLYFKTTDEMLADLAYLGEKKAFEVVVTNTNLIADKIEEIQPIPDGVFLPKIIGADGELYAICTNRLYELFDAKLLDAAENRLRAEYDSIVKNDYASAYIIARQLVNKSKGDGYFVGSRGCVGASFVAYLLGITEVDPLAHDMPFEAFAGINGDKLPDFTLVFDWEYESVIHEYVYEIFGEDKVFRAGAIITMKEKTADAYISKYCDEKGICLSPGEIDRIKKGIIGVKKTLAQLPGGVFILPESKEIFDFTPVQFQNPVFGSPIKCTHFDYLALNDTLLKYYLLGHCSQTLLRKLQRGTGVEFKCISLEDGATLELLINKDALGVPEFGTPLARGIIQAAEPKTFSDFVKICGLIHGDSVWHNNADKLIDYGIASLSEVIALRDEVMIYLIGKGINR